MNNPKKKPYSVRQAPTCELVLFVLHICHFDTFFTAKAISRWPFFVAKVKMMSIMLI